MTSNLMSAGMESDSHLQIPFERIHQYQVSQPGHSTSEEARAFQNPRLKVVGATPVSRSTNATVQLAVERVRAAVASYRNAHGAVGAGVPADD